MAVGVFPVWEGRKDLGHTFKSIYLDVTGKQHPSKFHRSDAVFVDAKEGGVSPPSERVAEVHEKKGEDQ